MSNIDALALDIVYALIGSGSTWKVTLGEY